VAQPSCFVVMPFRTKPTGAEAGEGPAHVDYDALWAKALAPAMRELGYRPIRADQDTGALIVHDMLLRLAHADLVVADLSIANANVYYEIGVRHAAKDRHCLLIAADWAKPVFDLGQMRRLSYPLPEGAITDSTAAAVTTHLVSSAKPLIDGLTPVFQAVPNFPNATGLEQDLEAFEDEIEALVSWNESIAGIRAIHDPQRRTRRAFQLRDELITQHAISDAVRIEMLRFLRDTTSDWREVIAWIERMPPYLQQRQDVAEQRLLANAKLKGVDLNERVGAITSLITRFGPSSERCGLLGGRFKDLYDATKKTLQEIGQDAPNRSELQIQAKDYLNKAIEAYRQGMLCDLNDYYPSCNLPGLLQIRGLPGDDALARTAAGIAALACQRAKVLGSKDPWLNPTLLLAAFQAGNVELAQTLAAQVRSDGPAVWQLDSVLRDLRRTIEDTTANGERPRLQSIVTELERM